MPAAAGSVHSGARAADPASEAYIGIGEPEGSARDDHDGRVRLLLAQGGTQIVVRRKASERRPGGRFGAAVALVDVTGDERNDVVIGAPGVRGRSRAARAGTVYLLYGAKRGVRTSGQVALVPPAAQAGAEFGAALAHGQDWDDDDRVRTDLWIGAPGLDVRGVRDAGGVYHYRLNAKGRPTFVQLVTLATAGVPGKPARGDRFGEVLAPVLQDPDEDWASISVFVGVPRLDSAGRRDSGGLFLLRLNRAGRVTGARTVTQDSRGVAGKAEAGDRFGAAVAVGDADQTIAAVGAPGEDLGKRRNAGMVTVFTFTDDKAQRLTALRSFTQNSRGIPGRAQSGDQFGAALAAGGTLCDEEQNDVAVGAPGENLGRARDAGTVTVIPVQDVREGCRTRLLRQGRPPLAGEPAESGDRFGAALLSLPSYSGCDEDDCIHDLVVGAPGEDLPGKPNAGVVHELALNFGYTARAWSFPGPLARVGSGKVLAGGRQH